MSASYCLSELPIGADEFADYLLEQGVQYVLYNHKNEGGYPRSVYGETANHPWAFYRFGARATFALTEQIELLMKTHVQLFNNGAQVVIDLKQRQKSQTK